MSITNRHAVVPFVAGKSAPFDGQRLAKVGYKSSKTNPAKFPSVCASVPMIQDSEILSNVDRLVPYVRGLLESAQDGIIRSLYESSGGQRTEVGDSEISLDCIIGYLESESSGGRLTVDGLNAWFDTNVKDNLTVVIADKIGIADLDDAGISRITPHLNAYRQLIASLSGGKTILSPQQIAGIRKAIEVSSVDDETSVKLLSRLDAMEKKPKIEELLEL